MGVPLVVIEMAASDRGSPYLDALVRTCSESVAEGRCVLASDREEPDSSAVAIVTWADADRRVVEISVGVRGAPRWLSRRVEFKDADAMKERWRSVGLVIAALVGESHRAATEAAQPGAQSVTMEPPPAASSQPTPPPSSSSSSSTSTTTPPPAETPPAAPLTREIAWLDAGVALDPGVGGWLEWGAWVRGAVRPWSSPLFFLVSGRYAGTPTDDAGLSQRSAQAAAGAGTFFVLGSAARLEVHVDLLAELVHARATDATGKSDAADRWVGGARAAGDFVWFAWPAIAFVGGVEATALTSRTELRVAGASRGHDPAFGIGAIIGVRASYR
jgi:hypothetical protein